MIQKENFVLKASSNFNNDCYKLRLWILIGNIKGVVWKTYVRKLFLFMAWVWCRLAFANVSWAELLPPELLLNSVFSWFLKVLNLIMIYIP